MRFRIITSIGDWEQKPFFMRFKDGGGRMGMGQVYISWAHPLPGNDAFHFVLNIGTTTLGFYVR